MNSEEDPKHFIREALDTILADFKVGYPTRPEMWTHPNWVVVIEDGEYQGGYWDLGGAVCSDDFYQALLKHPLHKDNPITGVWIDEFSDYNFTEHTPKKQHKPKHVPPFWSNDWRNKR